MLISFELISKHVVLRPLFNTATPHESNTFISQLRFGKSKQNSVFCSPFMGGICQLIVLGFSFLSDLDVGPENVPIETFNLFF